MVIMNRKKNRKCDCGAKVKYNEQMYDIGQKFYCAKCKCDHHMKLFKKH